MRAGIKFMERLTPEEIRAYAQIGDSIYDQFVIPNPDKVIDVLDHLLKTRHILIEENECLLKQQEETVAINKDLRKLIDILTIKVDELEAEKEVDVRDIIAQTRQSMDEAVRQHFKVDKLYEIIEMKFNSEAKIFTIRLRDCPKTFTIPAQEVWDGKWMEVGRKITLEKLEEV